MALNIQPTVLFGTAQLPTGATVLFTAPSVSSGGAVSTKMVASNTTGASVALTLWKVSSGDSVGATTMLVPSLTIPALSDVIVNEVNGLVLMPGDKLIATPTVGAVLNITLSGYLFTS